MGHHQRATRFNTGTNTPAPPPATGAPEINVKGNGVSIVSGDATPSSGDWTDFGSSPVGTPVSRVFTIENLGDATLNITTPITVPSGFTCTSQPASTVAAAGSTTFTVRADAGSKATFSGNISIANDDSNENPYTFAITMTAIQAEMNVKGNSVSIVDGDATPSATDHTDFGSTPVGTTVTRTFTIENTGDDTLTITTPITVPSGFTCTVQPATSVAGGGSTTFQVRADAASKATFSGQISIANSDADENPYNFSITVTAIQAEMNVKGNSVSIADGDATPSATDHTDFGSTPVGTTVTRTFTIENTGDDTLTITTPITVPSGFTCTSQPSTSVAAGGSTTFQVRADASAVQVYSGDISIANSDADENPYNFAITANVTILTANLVSWHDASYAAGLWQDSGRTTPATANADVVGAIDDRSGNNYHATQGTTGNKATLRTSVQNSKNVIRFDGSDDFLSKSSYSDFGDNYTVYVVGKYASAGSGDGTQSFFDVSTGTANTGLALYHETTNNPTWYGRDASANRSVAPSGSIRDDVFRVHRAVNTGSGLQYWRNNSSIGTSAYTAPNPNTLNTLTIGRLVGASGYTLNGDIAEILIYSTNHDATQQAAMEAYLNAKWACY